MSYLYDEYLHDHIEGVQKAYGWLMEHHLIPADSFVQDLSEHDASKREPKEYEAYDRYFYSGNKSYKVVRDFNYAWLHHIHHNPHHWQYWVLQHDDAPEEALEMPKNRVIEMICDWWSFSWKSGNLGEIFDWYEKHKDMKLHENTRKMVEDILEKIQEILEEENHLEHNGIKGQKWGVRNGPPYPLNSDLRNKTPAKVEEIRNYKGKLYWLSEEDLDGKTLEPRIPDNFFTKNKYEDYQTKRLCFAPSIDQSLSAISQNLTGKTYNVYEPEQKVSTVWRPNKGAVPDSDITGELWVKEPTKLKKTGTITVSGDDGKDGMRFEYGDSEAELYGWNWNWKK